MKEVWSSVFQKVSQSVKKLNKNVNKKARHDVVLMTTGISVVTMLTFSAGDLSGNGQSGMVAFAETHMQTVTAETELEVTNLDELLIGEEHIANVEALMVEANESAETNVFVEETAEEIAEDEKYTETDETENAAEVMEEETKEETKEETEEESQPEEISEEEDEEASAEIALSPEDYNVLLRIVQAEAGTCDETGKLLVANVILNRVESERFPDTVYDVVYQKKQFSPVMNGTINTCKITMETRNAVNRALKGEDVSEGALFFMNRGKSASRNVRWFDANLEYLFKHGDHEFFK